MTGNKTSFFTAEVDVSTMADRFTCEKLMDHEIEHARSIIKETGEEVSNHFSVVFGNKIVYVNAPWRDGAERHEVLAFMREFLREKRAEFYVHASEAWMGSQPDIRPSEDPQRKELFFVAGIDRASHKKYHRVFPITRDEDGKRSLGEEEIMEDAASFSGSSFNLFDPDPELN